MLLLTEKQISEIAQELECGLRCFIHRDTGELISFPVEEMMADEELWEDVMNEIDENSDKYFEIDRKDTNDDYKTMERFIETVEDDQLRFRLSNAVSGAKPFHTFKYELNYSEEYLKKWFNFKYQELIDHVKKMIDIEFNGYNEFEEDEEC